MFRTVGPESWVGQRTAVWWATVRAPIIWLLVAVLGTAFAVTAFIRDEFLPENLQGPLRLVNLVGLVPWYAYILVVLFVLLAVTIEGLYRQFESHRDALQSINDSHEKAIDSVREQLDSLKAQNLGVSIKFGELQIFANEPGFDGVLVVAWITRLVNGNLTDASLEIVLRAPILLAGAFTISVAVSPDPDPTAASEFLAPRVPFLSHPINVLAKSNIGPRYILFNFRPAFLAMFPFQDLWKGRTVDDLAKAIEKSEMYFEVTDVANGTPPDRIDAPGTPSKRLIRLAAERQQKLSSRS